MSALERVMRAYTRKYKVNDAQAELVRAEISQFIQELSKGPAKVDVEEHDAPGSAVGVPKA